MALDVLEFMRRFLQHVLPSDFMKVRYYGFLSPSTKIPLEKVRTAIETVHGFAIAVPRLEPLSHLLPVRIVAVQIQDQLPPTGP